MQLIENRNKLQKQSVENCCVLLYWNAKRARGEVRGLWLVLHISFAGNYSSVSLFPFQYSSIMLRW